MYRSRPITPLVGAFIASAALACAEAPDAGDPLGVEPRPASTSATLAFHTQLHPPDPCVDFDPDRQFGHVQVKFSDLVAGSWTSAWGGMVRVGEAFPSGGELRDSGGELLGTFAAIVDRNFIGVVGLEGSGTLGDGTVQDMVAAPEEYVVRLLDAGGGILLEGNLGIHPPDPC